MYQPLQVEAQHSGQHLAIVHKAWSNRFFIFLEAEAEMKYGLRSCAKFFLEKNQRTYSCKMSSNGVRK